MFLGRKHKTRKRPTENKPKIVKKMVMGSHILIIILNVNGLNTTTKRHRLTGWMQTCTCILNTSLCLTLPKLDIFILLINHVSIMACNCNYLLFFVLLWISHYDIIIISVLTICTHAKLLQYYWSYFLYYYIPMTYLFYN